MASSEESPPEGYTARPATREDLPAIDRLYLENERALGTRPEPRSGYLGWRWSQEFVDLDRDTRLLERDGALAGFAMVFVEPHAATLGSGMWRVHPDHAGRGLGTWILGYVDRRSRDHPGVTTIRLGVEEEDVAGHRLLAEHGYERVRTSYDMAVPLRGDETPPADPPGMRVRPYVPGEERTLWRVEVEAFRDHWDHVEDQSYESFVADWFEDPDRPPRVLVGEVDGEPQGVVAWVVDHGVPYVYSVAVRRAARGRGLATALMAHTKAIVAAEGAEELTLSVDATNPTGAVRVYEKVGMTVQRTVAAYEKAIA